MAEFPEDRTEATRIPTSEYRNKWITGVRLSAKHNTRRIGIEKREVRISEVIRATREFNILVHSKMVDLCIQAGVEASHGHAAIARKLIAYKVKGYIDEIEEELKRISDRYKPIVLSLINDPELIEAYQRILEARGSNMSDPYKVYKAKVMAGVWEDIALGEHDLLHAYARKWERNWMSYRNIVNKINSVAKDVGIVFDRDLKPLLISTIYRITKEMKKKVVAQNEIDAVKSIALRYCTEMGNDADRCAKFINEVLGITTTTTTGATTDGRRRR